MDRKGKSPRLSQTTVFWRCLLCSRGCLAQKLIQERAAVQAKHEKLRYIQPSYIILKPALCGGLSGANSWADAAEQTGIQYWFTSALESNIGLDSIARLAIKRGIKMPQGLGTGELYHNNIPSPLYRDGAFLRHDAARPWIIPDLNGIHRFHRRMEQWQ